MVNIILNGCNGRMGKAVNNYVKNFQQLNIVAGVDTFQQESESYPVYNNINTCTETAQVVLDFSRPDSLDSLLNYCESKKLPLVICSTGFSEEQIAKINEYSKIIPIFRSANMSLGINLVNSILKQISSVLYETFDIEIIEKHHNQKVDSPSGTALLLADTIKNSISEETHYVKGRDGLKKREPNEIGIHAIRGGSIVGEHSVIFAGQSEVIEIKHQAESRDVFAMGALNACAFMAGKSAGLYDMDDLIKERTKNKE